MKNYEFHSKLAPYISGLIRQKQASGYSYEFEAYTLKNFDHFCICLLYTSPSPRD